MLFTDIVLIIAVLLMPAAIVLLGPPRRLRAVAGLAFLAVAAGTYSYLQLRWQAAPGVALGLFVLLGTLTATSIRSAATKIATHVTATLVLLLGLVCLAPLQQFPVPDLPRPSGPYAVGTQDFEVVDGARPETFSADPTSRRRLLVRAWYPAEKTDGYPRRPYRTRREAEVASPLFAATLALPPFLFQHRWLWGTHEFVGAPISTRQESYPVLIYSPGYLATVEASTHLMEDLASRGYIVFSIAHPYESMVVLYPNGELIGLSPEVTAYMQQRTVDEDAKVILTSADVGARYAATKRMYAKQTRLSLSSPIWRDDFISVANAVQAGAVPETLKPVAARADVSRLGYGGMSFGGGTAAIACHVDERCKAAFNLDGRDVTLDLFDADIRAPLMMVYQGNAAISPDGLRYNDFHYERTATVGQRADVYRFIVGETGHWDFTDETLLAKWPSSVKVLYPSLLGRIDGAHMLRLTADVAASFLDRHVAAVTQATPRDLLARYPEVIAQDVGKVRTWGQAQAAGSP